METNNKWTHEAKHMLTGVVTVTTVDTNFLTEGQKLALVALDDAGFRGTWGDEHAKEMRQLERMGLAYSTVVRTHIPQSEGGNHTGFKKKIFRSNSAGRALLAHLQNKI